MRSSTKLLAFARRKETREARERPSPRDLLSNIEVLVKEGCERERENGERGERGYIKGKGGGGGGRRRREEEGRRNTRWKRRSRRTKRRRRKGIYTWQ